MSTETRKTSSARSTKRGKLVVYGDVGQTFLYGAKGGEIYVLGNAAGRPMINAVGTAKGRHQRHRTRFPRRVFYGGESRWTGGGFAIVNGRATFDENGNAVMPL